MKTSDPKARTNILHDRQISNNTYSRKNINNTFRFDCDPLLRVYWFCNDSRSTRMKTGIIGRQQYMQ